MKIPFFFSKREHKKIRNKLIKSISRSLLHGQTLQGPEVKDLEIKMSKYIGTKHAIAVGSCTDALFFSLKAFGVIEGDEVIVTSYSYLASATCILRCGAKPVFVDVDENGNMDIDQVNKKITKKTKVIIYVHLFGYFSNIKKLKEIKRKKKIYLLEDFAQSFGARSGKIMSGSIGDISCTSFDPTKVISAPGSGGMAFTNNTKYKDMIVKMRYHGKSSDGDHVTLGMNSQLPSLVAATLAEKFKLVEKNQLARIRIAKEYILAFKKLNIKLPPFYADGRHIYHKFVIGSDKRNELSEYLTKNGIQNMVHYKRSIPKLTVFGQKKLIMPVANKLSKISISLPIHPYLSKEELIYIIKKVKTFFNKKNNSMI